MIMLTKEQLADLLRKSYDAGVWHGTHIPNDPIGEWSTKALEIRERAIQPLVHRSSGGHRDAERFAWMIEKAQTGSIGFGDFVLYPGDALDDVRAVIDSAMASRQEDGQ